MKKKTLPNFRNEADEQQFWAKADSTEFVDWSQAKRIKMINLKPTLRTISLRLPTSMIEDLKRLANQRDVPYQSLLKGILGGALEAGTPKLGSEVKQPIATAVLEQLPSMLI